LESCDVLVVGGGPGGSTCARQLRNAGLDVIVLDKKPFPRDKVCAGWVTPAVIEQLGLDCEDYRQHRVLQPFNGFRTGMMAGPLLTTEYEDVVSYGIRRYEFDHYLLERCGARLMLGEPVTRLTRRNDRWLINDSITAPLLVGAGGHFCPVARHLSGKTASNEHFITAQEVEFEMTPDQLEDCRVAADKPELYFCLDLDGYGWCVRKGNFLNIGLGRKCNGKLGSQVADFRASLAEWGRIPAGITDKFQGHAYLLYEQRSPRPLSSDHVLLIGDAAGLAYPQSGEGIRPAVESGLLAAQVIIGTAGDYHGDALAPYETRMIARFGKRGTNSGMLSWLPDGVKSIAARRLLSSPWFSRHVLLNRWFLHQDV